MNGIKKRLFQTAIIIDVYGVLYLPDNSTLRMVADSSKITQLNNIYGVKKVTSTKQSMLARHQLFYVMDVQVNPQKA